MDLVEDNVNGQIKKHYVYGELKSQTLDLTTRRGHQFYTDTESTALPATLLDGR